ncbi:MAG: hypothetical protein J7502_19640 [Flavisolibacter sp.]|nr:hypothetical protein [Flavisolibacter sp.]
MKTRTFDTAIADQAHNFKPESFRFLQLVKRKPLSCIAHVYDNFQLGELLELWQAWKYCAVSAEYGTFCNETDRKYLLFFTEKFEVIIEALHSTAAAWAMKENKKAKAFCISNEDFRYVRLNGEKHVHELINEFTRLYTEKQVKAYLWAMFESVLSDGKDYSISPGSAFFEYEAFLSIGRAPFYLEKNTPNWGHSSDVSEHISDEIN